MLRERQASTEKKLIDGSREGVLWLKTAKFLTFQMQKMAMMKRAPRPFLAIEQELAEKEVPFGGHRDGGEKPEIPFNL